MALLQPAGKTAGPWVRAWSINLVATGAPSSSGTLEWDYVSFGSYQWTDVHSASPSINCTGIHCSTDARFNVIRVGLNYRFDFGSTSDRFK
jgi:hypothetical protein